MMARARQAGVEVMMLTVDSITGGNRERDKRTGFAIPFRLNAASIMQFAMKPAWAIRSEEHTSELQSLMRISYAVFCLKKKTRPNSDSNNITHRSVTRKHTNTTSHKHSR